MDAGIHNEHATQLYCGGIVRTEARLLTENKPDKGGDPRPEWGSHQGRRPPSLPPPPPARPQVQRSRAPPGSLAAPDGSHCLIWSSRSCEKVPKSVSLPRLSFTDDDLLLLYLHPKGGLKVTQLNATIKLLKDGVHQQAYSVSAKKRRNLCVPSQKSFLYMSFKTFIL